MPDIFPTAVLYSLLDARYLNAYATTPQDALVLSGDLIADTDTPLPDANNPSARPTLFVNTSTDAYNWYLVDNNAPNPQGSKFIVDIKYQVIRLIPIASLNLWVKQG